MGVLTCPDCRRGTLVHEVADRFGCDLCGSRHIAAMTALCGPGWRLQQPGGVAARGSDEQTPAAMFAAESQYLN